MKLVYGSIVRVALILTMVLESPVPRMTAKLGKSNVSQDHSIREDEDKRVIISNTRVAHAPREAIDAGREEKTANLSSVGRRVVARELLHLPNAASADNRWCGHVEHRHLEVACVLLVEHTRGGLNEGNVDIGRAGQCHHQRPVGTEEG